MDFLNGKIKPMYLKYLAAAFGSAMITSVYSIVDTAMVGQYHGPQGTAALAVVAPVWNIIYSLGLLMGIGGSVIFSTKRGSEKRDGSENQYFTSSVIGAVVLSILAWIGIICFEHPVLTFFGADESLLVMAQEYMRPIKYVFPLFLFNQMLAAFLRNDGNPGLATLGVLSGGIFNIIGDYFFVFTCDMGIYGAGLATAIGSGISFLVMLTHFLNRKNTLRMVKPEKLLRKLREITVTGFSTFFIDVAMGILTVLFNRQIMKYLGANALAIYGTYHSGQYLCSVFCVQRRAGVPAHRFHQLRRKKRRTHQRNTAAGALDNGILRCVLDGTQHGVPECLYPHFYGTHTGDSGYGSRHCPHLCAVVPVAAIQHLFDLLFPSNHEAEGGVRRLRGAWTGHQRHFDHGSSCAGQRRCDLVCDADHGAACHALRRRYNRKIHKSFAGRCRLYR